MPRYRLDVAVGEGHRSTAIERRLILAVVKIHCDPELIGAQSMGMTRTSERASHSRSIRRHDSPRPASSSFVGL
jgi:hypothetical protein